MNSELKNNMQNEELVKSMVNISSLPAFRWRQSCSCGQSHDRPPFQTPHLYNGHSLASHSKLFRFLLVLVHIEDAILLYLRTIQLIKTWNILTAHKLRSVPSHIATKYLKKIIHIYTIKKFLSEWINWDEGGMISQKTCKCASLEVVSSMTLHHLPHFVGKFCTEWTQKMLKEKGRKMEVTY